MNSAEGAAGAPSSGKRVLVCVHGSGDSATIWRDLATRLPEYEVVALDLPGHGTLLQRPGPAQMSVADYADAVRAEITRRRLSGICLAGHSLGGAIALRLAMDYPSLVNRLVLVGTGARLRVLPTLLEQARTDQDGTAARLVQMGVAPGHAAVAGQILARREPLAPGMLARDLSACDAFDIMADLGRIAQPTLIVSGAHDVMTPPNYATYLHQHIDHSQLVVVPDAGHYSLVEAPDAVAAAVRAWLPATVAAQPIVAS